MTNDTNIIRQLEVLIRDMVRQEIKKIRFNKMQVATVKAVNGALVDVEFADDGILVEDIPNKTGETLTISDQIYVLRINNSSTNLVAILKKT